MRRLQLLTLVSASMLCFAPGCDDPEPAARADEDTLNAETKKSENDPRFHERLLGIAAEYPEYGLINPLAALAPEDCKAPPAKRVPVSLSKSDHASTHGKKLYYLFAKRDGDYLVNDMESAAKEGQALVKESWTAEDFKSDLVKPHKHKSGHEVLAYAVEGENGYTTGKQRELFIMYRDKEDAPGTDNGWVYGTVTADGKKVTSAGVVESCARCHRSAGDHRLFGPDGRGDKTPPSP